MKMIDRLKRLKVIATILIMLIIIEFFLILLYVIKAQADFVEIKTDKDVYYINTNNIITIFKNLDDTCNIKILVSLENAEEKISKIECDKLLGKNKNENYRSN